MAKLCEGRVAIVTGAGRGIDLGGTRDGTGADAGPAAEVVAEIRKAGGEAVANGSDVSDFASAKEMIEQAISAFCKLDVLVNNAGILRDRMLVNMTEAEWDAVIKVHLKGTFAPAHHAAAYWRERAKKGEKVEARLINTTSVSGIYGNAGQTNYGAAKAGIAAFTIIASRELVRYGITVNAIAPGALTRLTEDLGMGKGDEAQKARLHPRWIAPIVTWLASTQSGHVSGRVFEASGEILGVAESWHRGPTVEPVDDPTKIGPLVDELVAKARKNAGMNGQDLD
jgi:NAD(P)-dependent dehydrogenase (short-subunit alcohol dehydrogenase family)